MINLYEFLGIAPTNDLSAIQAAIAKSELAGKDAKMVQACKSYLLKPDWKAKHDAHFGIQFEPIVEVVKPAEPVVKKAIADMGSVAYQRMQDDKGLDTAELIAWGIFLLSLALMVFNFLGIFFFSGASLSGFGNYAGAAMKFIGFGLWTILFGVLATGLTIRRKLNAIQAALEK